MEPDKDQERQLGTHQPTPPFPVRLDDGCYRLLVQHHDKVFVFKPVPEAPSANLSLLTLPMGQIRALRVLPNNVSCRG
jgi:hypothetical protein